MWKLSVWRNGNQQITLYLCLTGQPLVFTKPSGCKVTQFRFAGRTQMYFTLQNIKEAGCATPFLPAGLHPVESGFSKGKNQRFFQLQQGNFLHSEIFDDYFYTIQFFVFL